MTNEHSALDRVSRLLSVAREDVRQRPLDADAATYFWTEGRGGSAVIVSHDGSLLYANSSVDPELHVQAFREGRRTPPDQFEV